MAKRCASKEKSIFLEILAQPVGTIEDKRSEDWVTSGKNATWIVITNDYNARCQHERTEKQLRVNPAMVSLTRGRFFENAA